MNKVFVLMVTKEEAGRYLGQVLRSICPHVSGVLVYDDKSRDETPIVADKEGAVVVVRGDETPSFLEHEGQFRQAALCALVETFNLDEGDWVLVLDADELLVSPFPLKAALQAATLDAEANGARAVRIPIHTVWGGEHVGRTMHRPLIRTDGFWPTLNEPRLWQWFPDAQFLKKSMGCRNEPTYVWQYPILESQFDVSLLHYGYAWPEDQIVRYERYSSLKDHGHNPSFINSIRTHPTTTKWRGPWMPMSKGAECESLS